MSTRLMFILFAFISTTFMGIGVTAVLAAGMVTAKMILLSAGAGLVLSLPVSWMIARSLLARSS